MNFKAMPKQTNSTNLHSHARTTYSTEINRMVGIGLGGERRSFRLKWMLFGWKWKRHFRTRKTPFSKIDEWKKNRTANDWRHTLAILMSSIHKRGYRALMCCDSKENFPIKLKLRTNERCLEIVFLHWYGTRYGEFNDLYRIFVGSTDNTAFLSR